MLESIIAKNIGAGIPGGSGTLKPEDQISLIDSLAIPEGLREWVKENNTEIIWEKLGVKEFTQYVADYLSRTIVHFILFTALFLLIWILLRLLMKVLDVFAKLPVIHGDRRRCDGTGRRPLRPVGFFHPAVLLCRDRLGTAASGADLRQRLAQVPVPVQYDHLVFKEHARRPPVGHAGHFL